jgi:hypothetical protein
MFAALALFSAFGTQAAAAGDYLLDWGDDFYLDQRSPYVKWMAETQVNGIGAPIAIANKPCFVYQGSRLVVYPCPGAYVARSEGGWVRARY